MTYPLPPPTLPCGCVAQIPCCMESTKCPPHDWMLSWLRVGHGLLVEEQNPGRCVPLQGRGQGVLGLAEGQVSPSLSEKEIGPISPGTTKDPFPLSLAPGSAGQRCPVPEAYVLSWGTLHSLATQGNLDPSVQGRLGPQLPLYDLTLGRSLFSRGLEESLG